MKKNQSKFEIVDAKVYFVMTQYVTYKNKPYSLELIKHIEDEVIVSSILWKNELFKKSINERIYRDSLTNAYNRRYYDEQISRVKCSKIAMIDIDNFKQINDNFGHKIGDLVQIEVSKVIQNHLGDGEILIRYGGDEFILIYFNNFSKEDFNRKLEEIRKSVFKITLSDIADFHVTISIGGYNDVSIVEDGLSYADEAMYEAKKVKNKVVVR